MAVKKKSVKDKKEKKENKTTGPGRKIFFFVSLLLLVLAVVAAFVLLLLQIPKVLLTQNPRFTLRRIEVNSSGFWQNNGQMLAQRIGIAPGDAFFDINVGEVRRKIMQIQNVDSCEVQLIVPDTMVINLTERVPRAILVNRNSNIVIDEFGKLFKKSESTAVKHNLPLIYGLCGFPMKPALNLIMTVIRDFNDINIQSISVAHEDHLKVDLIYRDMKKCHVLLPTDVEDYKFLLQTLQSAIINTSGYDNAVKNFDLRNSGQVILTR